MRLILNRYCMASRTHQAQCYRPHYVFCRPSVRLSVCRSCIRTTNLKTGKRKIRIFNPKGQPSQWPDVEKVHEIAAYWRICLRTDGGSGTDCKLSTEPLLDLIYSLRLRGLVTGRPHTMSPLGAVLLYVAFKLNLRRLIA